MPLARLRASLLLLALPAGATRAPQRSRVYCASRAAVLATAPRAAPSAAAASRAGEPGDAELEAEPCNVVLTHTNADFDSLAGSVAVAKLWNAEHCDVPTVVVMPRGANPTLKRFLAYHKHLFPIRGFATIRPTDVRRIGVVDTQSRERLGRAADWLPVASSVTIFDHHNAEGAATMPGDIVTSNANVESVVEAVGSATTLIIERLRQRGVSLRDAEATLFALGIRADTGCLTYEHTTVRDAKALVWLMEQGASQQAIAEFGQARMSPHQRVILTQALSVRAAAAPPARWLRARGRAACSSRCPASVPRNPSPEPRPSTHRPTCPHSCVRRCLPCAPQRATVSAYNGVKFATVVVDTEQFLTGMAHVAEELLELTACDVALLGVVHRGGGGGRAHYVSVIGRVGPRAVTVDLNVLLQPHGGGGHPKAAAASVRLADHASERGGAPAGVAVADGGEASAKASGAGASGADGAGAEVAAAAAAAAAAEAVAAEDAAALAQAQQLLDKLTRAAQAQVPAEVRAESIMTRQLITLTPDQTVDEARAVLSKNGFKGAPVVDPATRKLIGLLKVSDLVKAAQGGRGGSKIKGVVRTNVPTVPPTMTFVELEEFVMERGIGRLPVLDDSGALVGIITRTDILRHHNLYLSLQPGAARQGDE